MADQKPGLTSKLREEFGFSVKNLAEAAWKEVGFDPKFLASEGAKAGKEKATKWAEERREKRLGATDA